MIEHQKISICFDRMFCTPYLLGFLKQKVSHRCETLKKNFYLFLLPVRDSYYFYPYSIHSQEIHPLRVLR